MAPRAIARTDFDVVRLANLAGKVVAPKDVQIDNVVVRLVGTKLYTTPYEDGTFSFYNVARGNTKWRLTWRRFPTGTCWRRPRALPVAASSTGPAPPIRFRD